jgi:hypothetical protein
MLHSRILGEEIDIGAGGYCNTEKDSRVGMCSCSIIIAAKLIIRV